MSNMKALMEEWVSNLPTSPSGKLRMVPITQRSLEDSDTVGVCLEFERSTEDVDL